MTPRSIMRRMVFQPTSISWASASGRRGIGVAFRRRGMIERGVKCAQRGAHHMVAVVSGEPIDGLVGGERGVMDEGDAVLEASSNRGVAPGVGRESHAPRMGDFGSGGDLVIGHGHGLRWRESWRRAVAGQDELDDVDAFADHFAHRPAHFDGPIGDDLERLMEHMGLAGVEGPRRGDEFGRRRAHARPGYASGPYFVADRDIEARLARRRAHYRRGAVIENAPGVVHGDQDVFLDRYLADLLGGRALGERQMAMAVDEAGHERRAAGVDGPRAVARKPPAPLRDGPNAVAFDAHFAVEGRRPRAIEIPWHSQSAIAPWIIPLALPARRAVRVYGCIRCTILVPWTQVMSSTVDQGLIEIAENATI